MLVGTPAQAVSVAVPAGTRDDMTLCVAFVSRKAVQGMCFHIQE